MQNSRDRRHLPPVLLMTGQSGIGKRSFAYFFSQWILCEQVSPLPEVFLPCGQCAQCVKFLAGNNVDFIEILSNDPDKGGQQSAGLLKIDQFRKLKASAGFGANEGQFKVFLIPNAEKMTPQAAHSVLKLLEEPPSGWIFLLTAADPSLLLPTLVSRCQIIRLKPFHTDQLTELLELSGIEGERQKICAELAAGSWQRAIDFSSDSIWQHRASLNQFLTHPSSHLQALLDWASEDSSQFDIFLDLLEQLSSKLIRWSIESQAPSLIQSPLESELAQHAQALLRVYAHLGSSLNQVRAFWIERAEQIALARQAAQAPINRKLLIQNLLLPWLEPWTYNNSALGSQAG